jgi:hypothetical protein
MASRARLILATSLVALPCLAFVGPAFAHNGRDKGHTRQAEAARRSNEPRLTTQGVLLDIYDGIAISVDPRTGVRTYTQVGDITPNPARARSVAVSGGTGPGIDYWVEKSFQKNTGGYAPAPAAAPSSQMSVYEDDPGYSDYYGYGYGGYYGGYLGYGYGDRGGRGGHGGRGHGGGGDGRPGHPGDGGGGNHPQPAAYIPRTFPSPPPGPYGGGVGSPPPYYDAGVGAPPPVLRYNSFRGRRG